MKYFIDTEFFEDGPLKPVRPISLGIVCEDGREYYAEVEQDLSDVNDWLKANVVPHLHGPRRTRQQISADVVSFVDPTPEFWGWFSDYDWVVFCQLFGSMMGLPTHFPQFCLDLQQVAWREKRTPRSSFPAHVGNVHNALDDARWTKSLAQKLGVI